MKEIVKKFLKAIGVFGFIKNKFKNSEKRKRNFQKRFGDLRTWELDRRGVTVSYDITDLYSKKWFLPRYDRGKIHEPIATDLFIDHISEDSIVLDIGGHLGYFSCLAARLAILGEVHVFEVDPKCINLIAKNVKLNNFQNVTINNVAVSNHVGFESIPVFNNPNPSLIINSSQESIEVKAIQIDDYVRENNLVPDFIKIDVEGAEWKVLQGMKQIMDRDKIHILVEIHVDNLKDFFDTDYKEIIGCLIDKGFIIVKVDSHRKNRSEMTQVNRDSKLKGNTMIFCSKA